MHEAVLTDPTVAAQLDMVRMLGVDVRIHRDVHGIYPPRPCDLGAHARDIPASCLVYGPDDYTEACLGCVVSAAERAVERTASDLDRASVPRPELVMVEVVVDAGQPTRWVELADGSRIELPSAHIAPERCSGRVRRGISQTTGAGS